MHRQSESTEPLDQAPSKSTALNFSVFVYIVNFTMPAWHCQVNKTILPVLHTVLYVHQQLFSSCANRWFSFYWALSLPVVRNKSNFSPLLQFLTLFTVFELTLRVSQAVRMLLLLLLLFFQKLGDLFRTGQNSLCFKIRKSLWIWKIRNLKIKALLRVFKNHFRSPLRALSSRNHSSGPRTTAVWSSNPGLVSGKKTPNSLF